MPANPGGVVVDSSSQRGAMKNLLRETKLLYSPVSPGGVVVDSSSQRGAMKNLLRETKLLYSPVSPGGEIGRRNGLKIRR